MTRIVYGVLGLVWMAGGCSPDCTELCEEAESRGCNTFQLGAGSCAADCDLALRISEKAGCEGSYDARVECEASQDDVCEVGCSAEDNALQACGTSYCSANPTDPDCAILAGGP
jgi:hypothetical protein